ncbi:MAG: hypothetical protein ACFCVA_04370, partial [Gammaproteobacteria bacterium]
PPEQGARQRESGVYKGVHEHFELPRNAAQASAVIFKTASEAGAGLLCRGFPSWSLPDVHRRQTNMGSVTGASVKH